MMDVRSPDISVLVCTRNRVNALQRLLASLDEQQLGGLECELIVVDNGSTDGTRSLLSQELHQLTITTLYEPIPGKSRALNRALAAAHGQLLAFTDDDITTSPMWLSALYECSVRYPTASVFCGPTTPCFPPGVPEWLTTHPFAAPMFARFEPDQADGPLPANLLPFGCNFAVRAAAIAEMTFRLDLGPSLEKGPTFGEDLDFVQRLQQQSPEVIFFRAAQVFHHIDRSRTELKQIYERAFHIGRAGVIQTGRPSFNHAWFDFSASSTDPVRQFERGGLINYYCGQLCELCALGDVSFDEQLWRIVDELAVRSHLDLLSDPALKFYESSCQTV